MLYICIFSNKFDITQAPRVIPQLIVSLCTISIATCKKLFEIMTCFNGDKIRPRLAVKAGDKTFSWLFDTGAAVTCMNKQSFDLAFGHSKPKQISKPQSCVAASGTKCLPTEFLKWTCLSKAKSLHSQ
jgi:hypothetical protein